jgi:probable phosphoglycerate mutase
VSGAAARPEIVLVRHAETEWSRDGRHTGRTDIPLTDAGRAAAVALAPRLAARQFALVLCSPLSRARETCALAGLGKRAQYRDDLLEFDYGDYEGLTSAQILEQRPDWSLWRDGCPGGERPADVGARAERVIDECERAGGDVVVFSHGHVLRILAARWIGLDAASGALLALDAAALAVLGHEHDWRVLRRWNLIAGEA